MNKFIYRQFKELNKLSERYMYSFIDDPFLDKGEITYTLSKNVRMVIAPDYVMFYNIKTNAIGKSKVHKDDMNKKTTMGITIALAWARYKGEKIPPLTIPTTCKTENLKVGEIYYYHPQGTRYKVLAVYEDGFISHPLLIHSKPSFSFHSTVTVNRDIF